MIVDTSAIIAILRHEPDAPSYAAAIAAAPVSPRRMSAAHYLEAAVDGSRDAVASRRLDDFMREAAIAIEPMTESHARRAREAYRDFGEGRGHPANVNFGDCFADAPAKASCESRPFKGEDFGPTDGVSTLPRGADRDPRPRGALAGPRHSVQRSRPSRLRGARAPLSRSLRRNRTRSHGG